MAGFAKVAREMLFGEGGAVGETDVVAVGDFVGSCHWKGEERMVSEVRW